MAVHVVRSDVMPSQWKSIEPLNFPYTDALKHNKQTNKLIHPSILQLNYLDHGVI